MHKLHAAVECEFFNVDSSPDPIDRYLHSTRFQMSFNNSQSFEFMNKFTRLSSADSNTKRLTKSRNHKINLLTSINCENSHYWQNIIKLLQRLTE